MKVCKVRVVGTIKCSTGPWCWTMERRGRGVLPAGAGVRVVDRPEWEIFTTTRDGTRYGRRWATKAEARTEWARLRAKHGG